MLEKKITPQPDIVEKTSGKYKWIVLSNTTIAVLMATIDSSIVIIALPYLLQSIQSKMPGGTSPVTSSAYAIASANSFVDVIWVMMGYMLITATLLLFFGRLADIKGRVKIYNAGFAVFTIGSLLTGLSGLIIPNSLMTEGLQMILFRFLQAIGAAMLWSNSAALLTDAFPSNQRGLALGTNMVAAIGGSVLGLILGGVITAVASWRFIFFINVPIGIFGTVWAYLRLKEKATIKPNQRLDILGSVLFSGAISVLLVGATLFTLGEMTSSAPASSSFYVTFHPYLRDSFILFAAFPVLLALFVLNEIYFTKQPMIKFALFKSKMFSAGVLASSLQSIGRGGITFLMVFYFEGVRGFSAFNAGLSIIPMSVGFLVVGPLSGILSDKIGYRLLTTIGIAISGSAIFAISQMPQSANPLEATVILAIAGIGGGMFGSPNMSSIMGSVNPEDRGSGAAVNSTLINVASMLAITLAFVFIGTTVNISGFTSLFVGSVNNIPASIVNSSQYQSQWMSFMNAFHSVFFVFTFVVLIAIIPSALRPKGLIKTPHSEPKADAVA